MVVNLKILSKIRELIGNSAPSELYDMFEEILTEQAKYDEVEKEEEFIKKFYAGMLEINSNNVVIMKYLENKKIE